MDESTFALLGFSQVVRAAKRFGAAPPSNTWAGVTALAHPDQLVEITATATDLNGEVLM
jgi:enamine deaminase RidA (YjgF/YER057c/UK114 family)